MKKNQEDCPGCPMYVGSTIIGERGQMVIPKEVRKIYDIKKGDHFVIMVGHKDNIIALVPMQKAKEMLKHMTKQLDDVIKGK